MFPGKLSNMSYRRWPVVAAGLLIVLCLGVAYSWGVFLIPISESTGWTRAAVSLAVSILLLIFSISMAIGGVLEKNIGPRKTALLGGLFVSIGWIAASFSMSLNWLYVAYGLIAGIGTGLCYLSAISTGIKWFPEKRATITGVIIFGFGCGSAFFAPLGAKFISAWGWRSTMLIYGIAFGIVIMTAAGFLKVPHKEGQAVSKKEEGPDISPLGMIRTRTFKIMFVTYFFSMVAGMMIIGHIVPFLKDSGYTFMQAAFAITVIAFFNGTGRVLFGAVADRAGACKTLASLFLVTGIMMVAMDFLPSIVLVYVAVGIIGLCFGGFLSVYPALTCNCFGIDNFGVNYGIVFTSYGMGCFAGPWLGGMVHDATGSYTTAFVFAGIMALAAGIMSFVYLKDRKMLNAV